MDETKGSLSKRIRFEQVVAFCAMPKMTPGNVETPKPNFLLPFAQKVTRLPKNSIRNPTY
jgi:hypothetical protein